MWESASAKSTRLTVLDNTCKGKTSGVDAHGLIEESCSYRGVSRVWKLPIVQRSYKGDGVSGNHTVSQALAKDCTMVYGECKGITDDTIVQDECETHGLISRG